MSRRFNLAVVGATGAVGENMLKVLEARQFPVSNLYALASRRSLGKTVTFAGESVAVSDLEKFDFSQTELALFSAGSDVSEKFAPVAARQGCIVIDNTSCFRYEDDIPLIIPEINPEAAAGYKARNIIANPNCSTIQMLVALKPVYDKAGIKLINLSTYQAVSGAGKNAMSELTQQTAKILRGEPLTGQDVNVFNKVIAFNAIPQIDVFQDNDYTKEEMKMVWETHKIMGDNTIRVNPTCVRVPVFDGHSESVYIETEKPLDAATARSVLAESPGIKVIDDPSVSAYPTACQAKQSYHVFIGRIRNAIDNPYGLNMWIVSDNLLKGAALNSVQIAELLIQKQYI